MPHTVVTLFAAYGLCLMGCGCTRARMQVSPAVVELDCEAGAACRVLTLDMHRLSGDAQLVANNLPHDVRRAFLQTLGRGGAEVWVGPTGDAYSSLQVVAQKLQKLQEARGAGRGADRWVHFVFPPSLPPSFLSPLSQSAVRASAMLAACLRRQGARMPACMASAQLMHGSFHAPAASQACKATQWATRMAPCGCGCLLQAAGLG